MKNLWLVLFMLGFASVARASMPQGAEDVDTTWQLAVGIGLLMAARLWFRAYRDRGMAAIPSSIAQWQWLLALSLAVLVGAAFTVQGIVKSSWVNTLLHPAPAATPRTGTSQTAGQHLSCAIANTGNTSHTKDLRSTILDCHIEPRASTSSATTELTSTPHDDGDEAGMMALVLTALGIVVTLVTAVVISVARHAVEDIRGIESKIIGKDSEVQAAIDDFKNETRKKIDELSRTNTDMQLSIARSQVFFSAIRAGAEAIKEVQVEASNERAQSVLADRRNDWLDRIEVKRRLSEFYGKDLLEGSNLKKYSHYVHQVITDADAMHICDEDIALAKSIINYLRLVSERSDAALQDALHADDAKKIIKCLEFYVERVAQQHNKMRSE